MSLLWANATSTTEQSLDGSTRWTGAKFLDGQTIISNSITKVSFSLKKAGSPTGIITCHIITSDGTDTSSDNSINVTSITTSSVDYDFDFAAGVIVDANSFISVYVGDAGTSGDHVQVDFKTSATTLVEQYYGANYNTSKENNATPRMAVYGSVAPSSSATRLPPPPIVVHF